MEAKLDRLGEVVNGLVEVVDRLREVQAGHTATLARLDRRLSRVEGDLELVKLLLDTVRHDVDRKLDRLKDEFLLALGRETRVELLAAQGLNDERLDASERRVLALEARA